MDKTPDDLQLETRPRVNALRWDQLSLEQKLERLREVVKQLDQAKGWHGQRIADLSSHLAALDEHSHADGKVTIPIIGGHVRGEPKESGAVPKVEGWF